MYPPSQLRAMIADANAFRASLGSRTDEAAYYWRTHLATRIYELRRDLFHAEEGSRELVAAKTATDVLLNKRVAS